MMVAQGLVLVLAGIGLGTAGAFGLKRLIAGLLFGVTARDPVVFVTVPILLAVVAATAVWLPARRATRINLPTALRHE
jgi:ABC-type antimicrobial peptide transport system permease subunit